MDNNTVIFTDCTVGVKQNAIKGVFEANFNHPCEMKTLPEEQKRDFKTPLQYQDFYDVIGQRMKQLSDASIGIPGYLASIQKGYYKIGPLWHLTAIVSVKSPKGEHVEAFASTAPVIKKMSDKKTKNPSRSFSDLFAEEFPKWSHVKDSVYTLLTGEDEKGWLQEPLRHCVKYLLR